MAREIRPSPAERKAPLFAIEFIDSSSLKQPFCPAGDARYGNHRQTGASRGDEIDFNDQSATLAGFYRCITALTHTPYRC
jgi:hypothetical protein